MLVWLVEVRGLARSSLETKEVLYDVEDPVEDKEERMVRKTIATAWESLNIYRDCFR